MSKYIDHEAAINAALLAKSDADITLVPGSFTNGFIEGAKIKENAILNALADVPAADVRPVVRAKWSMLSYDEAVCTCCGYNRNTPFNSTREAREHWGELPPYCEMCSAQMDGGVNDV